MGRGAVCARRVGTSIGVTRRACVRVHAPSVAACGGNVYVALSQIHLSSAREGKRRVGACAHITSHNALTRTHARTSAFSQ